MHEQNVSTTAKKIIKRSNTISIGRNFNDMPGHVNSYYLFDENML